MDGYALLIDGEVVPAKSLEEWSLWFKNPDACRVALAETDKGNVSTVFLGIDHSFDHGDPLWFETMIFDNENLGEYQERYATLEEAMQGHERAVAMVKSS